MKNRYVRNKKRKNGILKTILKLFLILTLVFSISVAYVHDISKARPNYIPDAKNEIITYFSNIASPLVHKNYTTDPHDTTLTYYLHGKKATMKYTVYGGVKEYLHSLDRSIEYHTTPPTEKDFAIKFMNNEVQTKYLSNLTKNIKRVTSNRDDQVRIAVSLVQNIPYRYSDGKQRYPYEVLYDNGGVCGEKSYLLAFLLKDLGYDTSLLAFKNENHMAVGIKCDAKYTYKGTGYCFIESATPIIITDSTSDYIGVGKLKSYPEVIHVSEGASFNPREEINDAREWIRINLLQSNVLNNYDYNKWIQLTKKYGIKVK